MRTHRARPLCLQWCTETVYFQGQAASKSQASRPPAARTASSGSNVAKQVHKPNPKPAGPASPVREAPKRQNEGKSGVTPDTKIQEESQHVSASIYMIPAQPCASEKLWFTVARARNESVHILNETRVPVHIIPINYRSGQQAWCIVARGRNKLMHIYNGDPTPCPSDSAVTVCAANANGLSVIGRWEQLLSRCNGITVLSETHCAASMQKSLPYSAEDFTVF